MINIQKRILAILLIAIIAVGVGVAVYFFRPIPPPYFRAWSTPGVSGIPEDRWIKIGLMGDVGELEGDQNYQGGYLAVRYINTHDGVVVNGTTYYVAILSEDTDESAPDFPTLRSVAAAERMVYKDECMYAVGGFKTDCLHDYRESFMLNKILFMSTGAMADIFCNDLSNNYSHYKYYFRVSPLNSSWTNTVFVSSVLGMYESLLAIYGSDDINHMGILAENLAWTEDIRTTVAGDINAYFPGAVTTDSVIAFDPQVTPTIMNSYLQQLENEGVDVCLIAISLGAGLTITQNWAAQQRTFLLFGANVQAQTADYWDKTSGACEYEMGSTTATRCNKTPTTIRVYDEFYNVFGTHPIDIGFAAYDSITYICDAIEATQSFSTDRIVAELETHNNNNPEHGAGGNISWNGNHDLYGGYPYAYNIWFQWQNGTKTLIPSFTDPEQYPETLSPMGELKIPLWFDWDEL